MIIVEINASSLVQFVMRSDIAANKKTPEIKASLDKNKSQRMGDFRVK